MIQTKILKSKLVVWIAATFLLVAIILLYVILSKSYIKITVDPTSARVTVNNMVVPLDSQGAGNIAVKPGKASIEITAEGYIGYSEQVSLRAGRNSKYQVQLRKNPVPITIGDDPDASNNVQFVSEADEDDAIFYLGNNGSTLYKAKFNVDQDGDIASSLNKQISKPQLSGIKKVIWSPKKDAAIFQKDNGLYTFFDFKKYNFVDQEEVKYGENIGDLAWAPDDSKIAYYYAPPSGEKSLIFSNKTNNDITRMANLADMNVDNPYLAWSPDSKWLIMIPRNKDISQNKVYLFNTYTRSFSTVNDAGNNIEAVSTLDSSKIIYSSISADPRNPVKQSLSLMDIDGNNKKSLDLRAYIAKIAFLKSMPSDIIVATYDTDTGRESMFLYDFQQKAENGFKMKFNQNVYVKEMSLSNDDKILFYIANDKFYALVLNK